MCYYNGQKVTREEYIRLVNLEKQIVNFQKFKAVVNGFRYDESSVILKPKPGKKDFKLVEAHWEFIPPSVKNLKELQLIRKGINPHTGEVKKPIPWLNAMAENLIFNEEGKPSMFREAALSGRCLVLSSGFFDTMHTDSNTIPHYITVDNEGKEYFFMAGVGRTWIDQSTGEVLDTYAIVTTEGNDEPMKRVHNLKGRMPTILTEELAYEWLLGDLSLQRILEIASYQYPGEKMKAISVHKDFATRENPTEPCSYTEQTTLFS